MNTVCFNVEIIFECYEKVSKVGSANCKLFTQQNQKLKKKCESNIIESIWIYFHIFALLSVVCLLFCKHLRWCDILKVRLASNKYKRLDRSRDKYSHVVSSYSYECVNYAQYLSANTIDSKEQKLWSFWRRKKKLYWERKKKPKRSASNDRHFRTTLWKVNNVAVPGEFNLRWAWKRLLNHSR